ncbi:pregnancy-specific glycoprotein 22-like isoform X2 [Triplophysa dalaica]|nr:pregnancy-specific glycoprotein 22-like isoform X2 [Triplophysa dalaica]
MCRFNQTEICYAVLGHKLSLQMDPESQRYDATLKHHKTGNKTVDPTCKIKNDKIKENTCDLYKSRSDVMISNGAVIINHVIREDSGRYTIVLTDSTGSETSAELQMNVKGEDQMCRFNQTEICYAVLGHKLSLQMDPESQHYDAYIQHLKTGDRTVDPTCKIKNDKIKENTCDLYKSRSDVMIINGTVIINNVIREDSGRYTIVLTDSTGSETSAELQMNVKDSGSVVFVIVWSLQMMILLLLLGGFHIYIRNTHTSGGKLEEDTAL